MWRGNSILSKDTICTIFNAQIRCERNVTLDFPSFHSISLALEAGCLDCFYPDTTVNNWRGCPPARYAVEMSECAQWRVMVSLIY